MRNINERTKKYIKYKVTKTTEFETEITTKNRQENYNLKKVISLNRFKKEFFIFGYSGKKPEIVSI